MKFFLVILSVTTIYCNYSNLKPHFQNRYNTLLKFLDLKQDDEHNFITLSDCLDNPIFSATNKAVTPSEFVSGQDIKINVIGTMVKEQKIKSLLVELTINNLTITSNTQDYMNQLVPAGKYSYSYTYKMPKEISGSNSIFLYLINTNNERISCTKASFEI